MESVLSKKIFTVFILLHITVATIIAQENIFSQYFSTGTFYNPALAGDTRFIQMQVMERLQPLVSGMMMNNLLFSVDYKIQNHRSGIGVHVNQRTSAFSETQVKTNYSHTFLVKRKIWVKGGLGISWNCVNTNAYSYKFPDQYNMYGYTGDPTREPSLNEEAMFAGFSAGMAAYMEQGWFSLAFDNINRPVVDFAGSEERAPLLFITNMGYLFPIDKGKKAKRMFTRYGGIVPYSSIGPVLVFYKNGSFQSAGIGINAFTRPVYWGIQYRYNSINKPYFSEGVASVNFMAGYRNELFSVSYSYDFMVNRTPTNKKGAHEISVAYFFYTIREDYKSYSLFPYPNQLMY